MKCSQYHLIPPLRCALCGADTCSMYVLYRCGHLGPENMLTVLNWIVLYHHYSTIDIGIVFAVLSLYVQAV